MAGITNAEFAMKLIPYGFDTVTIGGYNTEMNPQMLVKGSQQEAGKSSITLKMRFIA